MVNLNGRLCKRLSDGAMCAILQHKFCIRSHCVCSKNHCFPSFFSLSLSLSLLQIGPSLTSAFIMSKIILLKVKTTTIYPLVKFTPLFYQKEKKKNKKQIVSIVLQLECFPNQSLKNHSSSFCCFCYNNSFNNYFAIC